jgi:hypothetical protein
MSNLKNPIRLNARISVRVFAYQIEYKRRRNRRNTSFKIAQTETINGYKVNRLLRWYEKEGNALVGEVILKGFSLNELQQVLDEPADSPMFFSYELTAEQIRYFQHKLEQVFDTNAYDYFLECDAI